MDFSVDDSVVFDSSIGLRDNFVSNTHDNIIHSIGDNDFEVDQLVDVELIGEEETISKASKLLYLLSRDSSENVHQSTENKSLVGLSVKCEEDAYKLYNDHAFENGFGIRRHRQRFRSGNVSLTMKSYCCSKEGKKLQKGTENKMYTKLDYRTGCEAKLQFSISSDGEWTVSKHIIDHNHAFCPIDQRHLLKSHRGVDRGYLEFIMLMKESGTKVSDVHRMLQKHAGGVSALGFTKRDAYNVLETERSKTFDGTDSNTLIGILKKRAEVESDFFL